MKLTEVTLDEIKGEFKINGTLRTVNQETGEDLDPLNKKVMAGGRSGLSFGWPPCKPQQTRSEEGQTTQYFAAGRGNYLIDFHGERSKQA